MNNSTPVSTRDLLSVLESIESNVELDEEPPAGTRQKGLTPSTRWIPSMHVSQRRTRRAGQRGTVLSARSMGARTLHTTPMSADDTTVMGPKRRQIVTPSLTCHHVRKTG
jgi:hypothetical protein